jgi:hypothetical protein
VPRYQVTGIPPQLAPGESLGLSAFFPHFTRLAASGAQSYKGGVTGRPGTAAIRMAPSRQGIPPSPDPGDMALMGTARSSDAPDAIWPNLYYDNPEVAAGGAGPGGGRYWPGAGMPVQMYDPVRPQDTTMIPVPAVDLRSLYQARSATLAGGINAQQESQLRQAINFVRWGRRRPGNGSNK